MTMNTGRCWAPSFPRIAWCRHCSHSECWPRRTQLTGSTTRRPSSSCRRPSTGRRPAGSLQSPIRYFSDYFHFCCFTAMTLSLLHLVINWEVFTINICCFLAEIYFISPFHLFRLLTKLGLRSGGQICISMQNCVYIGQAL